MSIPYSGTFKRSGGLVCAIGKALRSVNLKPVKRVTVAFDPFRPGNVHARDFLYYVSSPKIGNTNPNCIIKSEIFCDRREPTVTLNLTPEFAEKFGSENIIFKSENLTTLELFQLYNKYVTPLVPKEQPIVPLTTKVAKQRKK